MEYLNVITGISAALATVLFLFIIVWLLSKLDTKQTMIDKLEKELDFQLSECFRLDRLMEEKDRKNDRMHEIMSRIVEENRQFKATFIPVSSEYFEFLSKQVNDPHLRTFLFNSVKDFFQTVEARLPQGEPNEEI